MPLVGGDDVGGNDSPADVADHCESGGEEASDGEGSHGEFSGGEDSDGEGSDDEGSNNEGSNNEGSNNEGSNNEGSGASDEGSHGEFSGGEGSDDEGSDGASPSDSQKTLVLPGRPLTQQSRVRKAVQELGAFIHAVNTCQGFHVSFFKSSGPFKVPKQCSFLCDNCRFD